MLAVGSERGSPDANLSPPGMAQRIFDPGAPGEARGLVRAHGDPPHPDGSALAERSRRQIPPERIRG